MIFLWEGEWEGEVGGERGRQFYPRFNAAPCHLATQTTGTRGLGDERAKSKQTNFEQTAILKGEETAETEETRYLWKRFNSLK